MAADAVCQDANVQFSQMGNFCCSGRNGTNQIREQNNINISGLTGAREGHRGSTLTSKRASPALVSVCKRHLWPRPRDSSGGTKPKTSSSILINIKASISVSPLNTGQGSVRKMPSGCLACGSSPWGRGPRGGGSTFPPSPGGPGCPRSGRGQDALGYPPETGAPATWTHINRESRTEHTLGSVTMTISYRSIPGELRSPIKGECARSPPTQIITLASN